MKIIKSLLQDSFLTIKKNTKSLPYHRGFIKNF